MEKKKKIIVGLGAIVAGGGHIALRDYLQEELQRDKRYKVIPFTHSDTSFEKSNNVWPKISTFYNIIYKFMPRHFTGLSAVFLVGECDKFVKKYNPDIVISTHASIAAAFEIVKNSLKLNYLNINVVPDYGVPSDMILPTTRYIKPDYMIVLDDKAKAALSRKTIFPKDKLLVWGYAAKRSFREMVRKHKNKSKEKLLEEIKNDIGKTFTENISPAKRTIIITGGSGGVIDKSYGLLKYIIKHQKKNPLFKKNNQILIITGTNNKFFNRIFKRHIKDKKEWSNIIPIPLVNHEVYSKIQVFADFPVMMSIAPASMNELFESSCGPLIIHSTRKGQEMGNIHFVVKKKLGFYVPKKKDVLKRIVSGFTKKEKEVFQKEVDAYRKIRLERISKFPDQLAEIYYSHLSPKRKSDINRLKSMLNFKLISPVAWMSLALMTVPTTILFGLVQYYKQKNNLTKSKKMRTIINLINKMYPL